jgi:hypothetical protein
VERLVLQQTVVGGSAPLGYTGVVHHRKTTQATTLGCWLLSVKTRRRAATGNTRSRETSGTAGGPRSLGQRPSDLARTLAESR